MATALGGAKVELPEPEKHSACVVSGRQLVSCHTVADASLPWQEREPGIHAAIKFGAVLENVTFDEDSREVGALYLAPCCRTSPLCFGDCIPRAAEVQSHSVNGLVEAR